MKMGQERGYASQIVITLTNHNNPKTKFRTYRKCCINLQLILLN